MDDIIASQCRMRERQNKAGENSKTLVHSMNHGGRKPNKGSKYMKATEHPNWKVFL